MNTQMALDLAYETIMTAALASAPFLITAIVVGVVINIIQTVTSIRDMSLSFVPKVLAAAVVMAITLPWGMRIVIDYFVRMIGMIADVGA